MGRKIKAAMEDGDDFFGQARGRAAQANFYWVISCVLGSTNRLDI
jgi:hypothetical protein